MRPSQVLWIGSSTALPGGWPQPSADWDLHFQPPDEAIDSLARGGYAAVVLERKTCELLEQVHQVAPGVPVLVHDPGASLPDAVRLIRQGASQFLTSAEESFAIIDDAVADFRRGLARLASKVAGADWEHLLVGESREMQSIHQVIRLVT